MPLSLQTVGLGTISNDGSGDSLRTGGGKINNNFALIAGQLDTLAPLDSPAFTGTPLVPTAAPGTNNTQAASCAFVAATIVAATAGVATFNGRNGAVALVANDVIGVLGAGLPILNGGTGATSAAAARANLGITALGTLVTGAQGTVVYFGASGPAALAPGTSGQYLRTNGAGADPSWVTPAAGGSGDVPRIITSSADTTLQSSDTAVYFNRATSPAITTATLPASPSAGQRLTIKDMAGNAAAFPITVQASSGTIDGAANFVFDANYDGFTFEFNGIEWSVF